MHVAARHGSELVDVALAPYALDLRGRPRLGGAARAPRWVSARPARLRVGAEGSSREAGGRSASRRSSRRPAVRPRPHDPAAHGATVSRSGCGSACSSLAHVPGKAVRRLVIGPLRVRRGGAYAHPGARNPKRRQCRGAACARSAGAGAAPTRTCRRAPPPARPARSCRTAGRSSRRASVGRFAAL